MNTENKLSYNTHLEILIKAINEDYKKWSGGEFSSFKSDGLTLNISEGRKFDKIISDNSVWGFVAKTNGLLKDIPYFVGDVFKPAGWRGPAKHVRGSIFDTNIDWFSWTGPNYLK